MKIFLSLLLIFVSNTLFANDIFYDGWLRFGWKLDLGFMPQYEGGLYRLGDKTLFWIQENNVVREDLGLDVKLWNAWRIFTEINVYETPVNLVAYNPFRADFIVGTEWRFDMLIFGLRHRCDHPVEGDGLKERNEYHYGGNYTEIYLRIDGGYGWQP